MQLANPQVANPQMEQHRFSSKKFLVTCCLAGVKIIRFTNKYAFSNFDFG
jgi:hypothetical protein